ncbi:c-type cytochrome [Photobacterium damselae]|uniref:c-type cytochrome n=1 Tax=Photobacterium damselae TaxID=38293 RepID=UPI002543F9B9
MSLKRFSLFSALTILFTIGSVIAADMSNEAIEQRIKPVGSLYLEGDAPIVKVAAASRGGEQVYNTYCSACHTSGVMNAPKKGDAADWKDRLAQGQEILAKHAIEGFNAMPAKGSCMDCSDEEIIAAINYMAEGLTQ